MKDLTDTDLLRYPRAGHVPALFDHARVDPRAAYFWLLVAHDFGHREAGERIGDIEECYDVFKYDDDGLERSQIHQQLGEAYLRGTHSLDVDVEHGIEHLEEYLNGAGAGTLEGVEKLRALAAELEGFARQAVETCLEVQPFRAVQRRVDRLRRLYELDKASAQIPEVVITAEVESLRAEMDALIELLKRP